MNMTTNPMSMMDATKTQKAVMRNMILLLMGQLVSLFGSRIYSFAISLYILQVTGSGLNFSLTLALGTLPQVIFGPISGVIADRFDRKKMIVLLDILSGCVVLGLLGLSLLNGLKLYYIYTATFLLSTCSVFFNTPLGASLPNLVNDENLTRIHSLSQSISSIASIAGPFIGGIVFALVDIKVFLLINGLSFILSGISEIFIDFKIRDKIYGKKEDSTAQPSKQKIKASFFADLKEGLVYVVSQKWLMVLGSFVIFFNLFTMVGLTVPVPYIVREIWGFSSQQYGLLNMMFPLGMLGASICLSILPQAKSNYKPLITSMLVFSIAIFSVGVITSEKLFQLNNGGYLGLLMVAYTIMAIASAFINIPIMVTLQKLVPDDKRGRVQGTLGTFSMGLSPIGAILGGLLVDSINPSILPIACGIIMIILTVFMARMDEIKSI